MNKLVLLSFFIFQAFILNAQDIIIKKTGEEIKAKVIEVAAAEVKYKKYDFQDGPLYIISKSEILMIRYENGTNDIFSNDNSGNNNNYVNPPQNITPPVYYNTGPDQLGSRRIDESSGSYYQDGRYISRGRLYTILKSVNDPVINSHIQKSKSLKTAGSTVAVAVGLPLLIVGGITTMVGLIKYSAAVDPDATGYITTGAILMGTGVFFQLSNIGFSAKSRKHLEKAIDLYNDKIALEEGKK